MAGNIRLYNTNGYVELQAPSSASAQTLVLPTDSIQPGLVHLHTETFSAVSSISVDGCFTSAYENFKIVTTLIGSTSGSADVRFLMRSSGSNETGAVYYTGTTYVTNSGGPTRGYDGGVTSGMYFGGVGDILGHRVMELSKPEEAATTTFTAQWSGPGTSTSTYGVSAGFVGTTTSYDGFTMTRSSGTISGVIRVYGYRNS